MKVFIFSIIVISTIGQIGFGQVANPNDNLTSQKKLKKMIVYGSDTCHYCIDTKAFLQEKRIDFIYYDIDVNLAEQREMVLKLQKAGISIDNLSLPVVDLNGKLIMNGDDFEGFLKKLYASKTRGR